MLKTAGDFGMARCFRAYALISIVFIMGMALSPLSMLVIRESSGELPTIHDSSAPEEIEWVMIGYKRYIEQDSESMNRAYLALFCREVGEDTYKFRFQWVDSQYIAVEYEGERYEIEDYYFMGMVFRDNGFGNDPDVLWDTGMLKHRLAGDYSTRTSGNIRITDWTGVRFCGALMAHVTISPSYWDKLHGTILAVEVGVMIGIAWSVNPFLGLAATVGGTLLLEWYAEECMQDDDVNVYYHSFYGGLDLLNDPEACVQMQVFADYGYDLPDELENPPLNRKYVDQFDICVQCAFPSKISMDMFMLSKDDSSELYEQQALSRINRGSTGTPNIIALDFPISKIRTPPDAGDLRTLELEWDLTKHYFEYQGFDDEDFQTHVQNGKFIPLDERYRYLRSMDCHSWDIPTIQFQLKVEIDYELPPEAIEEYPADPLHTIYQEQRLCTALDYYSLGHTEQNERIELDSYSDYNVCLGDESIMSGAGMVLIPLFIGQYLLGEGGIFLDMPEDYLDLVILPSQVYEIIGSITDYADPDRKYSIANPEKWTENCSGIIDDAMKKIFPIHSITIPDPWNTSYVILEPGIIPESLDTDPPPYAVDIPYRDIAERNYDAWRNLVQGNAELYEDLTTSEVERRRRVALEVDQGVPGSDMVTAYLPDPGRAYSIGIELPDGQELELITINPLLEGEIGSYTINDNTAYTLIPGLPEGSDQGSGFIATLPFEEDGTIMNIRAPVEEKDSIWLNSLPRPEHHTIIALEGNNDNRAGGNHLIISILEEELTAPVRSFESPTGKPVINPGYIGNFIDVEDGVTSITTYTPEFPFALSPRSSCALDTSPSAALMDFDPTGESGFLVSSEPAIPNYSLKSALDPERTIFELTLSRDRMVDDEMGLIITETTTMQDGIIVRGITSFPSPAPLGEIASWIVSPGYFHRDTLRSRAEHDNYVYSKHILETSVETGSYDHLVHHPGMDGEFFTLGSVEQDGRFMRENGGFAFVTLARQRSDDLFYCTKITVEDVFITVDRVGEQAFLLSVRGSCNRLDGNTLQVSLDDGNGNLMETEAVTMFGRYNVVMDTNILPGGSYTLRVMDDDGNAEETTIALAESVAV